jgi:aarF domain-containing kinase
MDYCEGFAIRDVQRLDAYGVDRDLLLSRVCAAWAAQMHVAGVFNADPHAGNILVSTARSGAADASVPVLLDFGLTKRLSPPLKLAFARLVHASDASDVDGLLQVRDR